MKALVCIKRVIDPYVKVRIQADELDVEIKNVKMSMNPFDEIALEEAIRLREKQIVSEIVVVSIGSDPVQETLRHALALGADRAILVNADQKFCSLNVANILKQVVINEQPQLVLMGKQSIDGDNNQTSQMLAAKLGWPQATFASALEINSQYLRVTREVDQGLEILDLPLPAVVSVDLRLNEPRYVSLPNIMKAKQKVLTIIPLAELNLSLREHIQILKLSSPSSHRNVVILDSAQDLYATLNSKLGV